MKIYCGHCGFSSIDPSMMIKNGCEACGSRKMSNKPPKKNQDDTKFDENINIYVRGKGEFVVNLKSLLKKSEGDPLVVADDKGKINVLFD